MFVKYFIKHVKNVSFFKWICINFYKLYTKLIDGQKFEEEFYQIWRLNFDKEYSSEEILKIDNEKLIDSKGLSIIMSTLSTDCDDFEPELSLSEYYEISEVELKTLVNKDLY